MNIENPIGMAAGYKHAYNDDCFWTKVTRVVKQAGGKAIELGCTLYYTLKDPDTPMHAKGIIVGALGYFISPLDLLVDVVPVIGYTDDVAVMVAALAVVVAHVKPEHKQLAKETTARLF